MNFLKHILSSIFITYILTTQSFASSPPQNDALHQLTEGIIVNHIWHMRANEQVLQTYSTEAESRIKTTLNIDELNETQKLIIKPIVNVFLSVPEKILLDPLYMAQAKQILLKDLSIQDIQNLTDGEQIKNPNIYTKLANAKVKITELGSTLIQNMINDPNFKQKINDEIQAIIQKSAVLENLNTEQ